MWGMLHLNFSIFQMFDFGALTVIAHQLLWFFFFFWSRKIFKNLWWIHKFENCTPVAQNYCAEWWCWLYRLIADCSNREINIIWMTQGIIKTTSSTSNHSIPQKVDAVFVQLFTALLLKIWLAPQKQLWTTSEKVSEAWSSLQVKEWLCSNKASYQWELKGHKGIS